MKQPMMVFLTVALLVNGLVTLAVVQNTAAGLTQEEFNALTDSIFGATGVPGRGPSIPNIPGGVPGSPNNLGGVHDVHGIPNIPGGVPGIPNISGGPPIPSGIPSNIFGP
ncbi:MAG: hypothetical protein WCE93_05395 [Nitrososphaeraceae archaeon]